MKRKKWCCVCVNWRRVWRVEYRIYNRLQLINGKISSIPLHFPSSSSYSRKIPGRPTPTNPRIKLNPNNAKVPELGNNLSNLEPIPRNDVYLMGSDYLSDFLGCHLPEVRNTHSFSFPFLYWLIQDEAHRKKRNHSKFDDSEDYEENRRSSKKRYSPQIPRQVNSNKIEALLEWKEQLLELPLTINYIEEHKNIISTNNLPFKIKKCKNISTENLSSLGEDIEALFINIEWGRKGQTFKDFETLKINKLMRKGIAFIWAPK